MAIINNQADVKINFFRARAKAQGVEATQQTTGTQAAEERSQDAETGTSAEDGRLRLPGNQESTAINDNPAQHTQAEQDVIEAYKNGTDPSLAAFIVRVRGLQNQNYKNGVRTDIHTETNNAARKAAELTGVDTTGYKNIINGSSIQHIDNRHGENGAADQSMANIDDFARIGFVLDNFTDARVLPISEIDKETARLARGWMNSDNTPAPLIQFSMPINGVFYVVEAVPSSKAKALAVISAYIGKNKGQYPQSSAETAGIPTASVTSETPLELLGTANETIPQPESPVNTGSTAGLSLPQSAAPTAPSSEGAGGPQTFSELVAQQWAGQGRSDAGEDLSPRRYAAPPSSEGGNTGNGGIANGTEQQNGRLVAAESRGTAAKAQNPVYGGDAGRRSSDNGGGRAGALLAAAPDGRSREHQNLIRQRRAAAADQPFVSGQDLGAETGTDLASLQVIPEESWDTELRDLADFLHARGVREVRYVLGMLQADVGAGPVSVADITNATAGTMLIRADSINKSASQIAVHAWVHTVATEEQVRAFRDAVKQNYKEAAWGRMYELYRAKWAALANDYAGMTTEQADLYVWEEILGDAYSKTNNFGTAAGVYNAEAVQVMEGGAETAEAGREGRLLLPDERERLQQTTRGPPERYALAENQEEKTEIQFTDADVQAVQSLGQKNVRDLTSEELRSIEPFAQKAWGDMGTHSPFFNAWFGDWRANDQTPVQAADVQEQKQYKAGKEFNPDIQRTISWGDTLKKETNTHLRSGGSANQMLGNIGELVKHAVLFDTAISTPDSKSKMPGTVFMHYMYVLAEDGENTNLLKLFVEEAVSGKGEDFTRAYDLRDIKTVATSTNGVLSLPGGLTDANIATIHTVADLFAAVKAHDPTFHPQPSSVIVNADGSPKIVYHGTDAEFEAFDSTRGRSTMDIQGMFFSPWELDAGGYGGNVGAYYLNLRNPAPEAVAYRALNRFKGQNNAGAKAREYLISQGYDGVNNSDEEYIAFYPEQVKSATDNVGTFDRGDSRYRYMVEDEEAGTKTQQSRLDTARGMLDNGSTNSAVYAETGIIVQANGDLRDGFDGTIIGRYENVRNDQGGVLQAGEAAERSAAGRETGRGLEQDLGEPEKARGREWEKLSANVRGRIVRTVEQYMENAEDDGVQLYLEYGPEAFAEQFYSMLQEDRIVAEQWRAFIPDVQGLMDEIDSLTDKKNIRYMAEDEEEGLQLLRAENDPESAGERQYTYDALIKKDPVRIVPVQSREIPTRRKRIDAGKLAAEARSQAPVLVYQMPTGETRQQRYVFIPDLNANVLVQPEGFAHGSVGNITNRSSRETAEITPELVEILRNSIKINERGPRANPKPTDGEYGNILIGIAQNEKGDVYIVRSTVNHFANNKSGLESMEIYDVLKGSRARKMESEVMRTLGIEMPQLYANASDSTITVADLLELVKENYPKFLSKDVLAHFGMDRNAQETGIRYMAEDEEEGLQLPRVEADTTTASTADSSSRRESQAAQQTPEAKALQAEIDRRSDLFFQQDLLRDGGLDALKKNDAEIRKLQRRLERLNSTAAQEKTQQKKTQPKRTGTAQEKRAEQAKKSQTVPTLAKRDLRTNLLNLFSIPEGSRNTLGGVIDSVADRLLKNRKLTQEDRDALFDLMYRSGVMTAAADPNYEAARAAVRGGRIYISEATAGDFLPEELSALRKRAFAAGVYFTDNPADAGRVDKRGGYGYNGVQGACRRPYV